MDELEPSEKRQPIAFGGWLIIVALGVIFSPIRLLLTIFTDFIPIFTKGAWARLTNPDDSAYIPHFSEFFITEIFVNIAMDLAWFYLAYLFFSKKSSLPKWYLGLSVFSIIFILFDAYVGTHLTSNNNALDADVMKEVFRSLAALLIWSPYLLLSQRSKDTFVN